MIPPAIPSDEAQRLAALQELMILDTAEEERFDRLARLAVTIFKVPISLVSLVDRDRQWFKSHIGLEARETSREISFCGHAILGEEAFVVEDAAGDERFADNPLVTGHPDIRFYAGRPLKVSGQKVGTLCLIDRVPRTLSEAEKQVLEDLAAMVERELEATRASTVDELTGAYNKRGFLAFMGKALNICRRQGISSTLLYFDLDDFKEINDTFGHLAGDEALRTFANIVRETCRVGDVFGRLGGDEFALWLSYSTMDVLETIVRRIGEGVDEFNGTGAAKYRLGFSWGGVPVEASEAATTGELLERADAAMYEMKRGKKSRNRSTR